MDLQETKLLQAHAVQVAVTMAMFGSPFEQHMAEAIMTGGIENIKKIKDAWPDEWKHYLHMADVGEQVEARELDNRASSQPAPEQQVIELKFNRKELVEQLRDIWEGTDELKHEILERHVKQAGTPGWIHLTTTQMIDVMEEVKYGPKKNGP